jgi:hypothetical protein
MNLTQFSPIKILMLGPLYSEAMNLYLTLEATILLKKVTVQVAFPYTQVRSTGAPRRTLCNETVYYYV